jgi:hypothetical protein
MVMIRPEIEQASRELAAVVDEDPLRGKTLCDESVAGLDDVLAAKMLTHLDRERLAAVDIHDGQGSKALSIHQLIGHEVHAPRLVGSARHEALASGHHHLASPRQLAAQLQGLFAIEPIRRIPSHRPALPSQPHVDPPVAEAHPRAGDVVHAPAQSLLRILRALVVEGAAMQPHQSTGPPPSQRVVVVHVANH